MFCVGAFEDWASVHVGAGSWVVKVEEFDELFQDFAYYFMVVAAVGVAGDAACAGIEGFLIVVVIFCENYYGFFGRNSGFLHVGHVRFKVLFKPFFVLLGIFGVQL